MKLDDVVDELYGLLPGEFTAARDARAKEARASGAGETANAIKRLRRPTAGAFLANLLVRERPDELDALLGLGSAMRQAQADGDGGELRRLSQERRQAIARLAEDAGRLASGRGQQPGGGAARELEETLEAGVADPEAGAAVRSGRLTTALRFSGFGPVDLSGAVASPPAATKPESPARPAGPGSRAAPAKAATRAAPAKAGGSPARGRAGAPPPSKSVSDRRRHQLEEAERALREAEASVAEATREAARLEERLAAARQRDDSLRAERRELEGRLRRLRQEEEEADGELREAKAALDAGDRARRAAQARLDRAGAARQRLDR